MAPDVGGNEPPVAVVSNFTPGAAPAYVLPPARRRWREVINTDASDYGGSGAGNSAPSPPSILTVRGKPASAKITLPPLATLMFVLDG